MSLRNRELLNLLGVGIVTGLGFASVFIAQQSVISTASLSYLAFFLGLYVAAHLVVRAVLPYADPYVMPIVALLTGIGLTMIYRVDPDLALRQGLWLVVGVAVFSACAILIRDYRVLDGVKYILGLAAIVLLVLPAVPGLGSTINGAALWVELGPDRLPAGRAGEGALRRLPRRLPPRSPGAPRPAGSGRFGLPSLKHAGPLLVIWGGAMLVLFQTNDLGGGLLYFSVFLPMLYMATGRFAFVAVGSVLFALGAYGLYHVVPHVEERVSIWLHPWSDPFGRRLSAGPVDLRDLRRRALRHRARQGRPAHAGGQPVHPVPETDFIYAGIAQELGLAGAAAVDPPLRRCSSTAASGSRCSRTTGSPSCSPPA